MTSFPSVGFDYSILSNNSSEFVKRQTQEIKLLMKRTAEDTVKIGKILIEVKEILGHGNFGIWLKYEFGWGEWTAQKFMQVARRFESVKFTDLQIAPSALYVLASPSTSEKARNEALNRAKEGEKITHAKAKKIKSKYLDEKENYEKSKDIRRYKVKNLSSLPEQNLTQLPSQQIIEVIPKNKIIVETKADVPKLKDETSIYGTWWQLGKKNKLYCGLPNSSEFRDGITENVALIMAFPSNQDWQLSSPIKANSAVALYSSYHDFELSIFREIVRKSMLIYTQSNDLVLFCFLPDIRLLEMANKLDCRFIVAEPNVARCQAAIAAWRE